MSAERNVRESLEYANRNLTQQLKERAEEITRLRILVDTEREIADAIDQMRISAIERIAMAIEDERRWDDPESVMAQGRNAGLDEAALIARSNRAEA